MPAEDLKEFVRKRPPFFWWLLANLLAVAFAVVSWTTCLYIFNYPEKPGNYDILRKLKRLAPVANFSPADSPPGDPANPRIAFKKFFPLNDQRLEALNVALKRNYLTNYKDPTFLTYVEGDFTVSLVRELHAGDFFFPGLAVLAQAFVETEESGETAPYPVMIELLLPTDGSISPEIYQQGDLLSLGKSTHRAAVVSVAKLGSHEEPVICLSIIPLAYEHYLGADGTPLPLVPPDPLNLSAPFPVLEQNRTR